MKKINLILALLVTSFLNAKDKEITVTASLPTAKIFVNGKEVGQGSAKILIKAYSSVIVEVVLKGYNTRKITYYNDKEHPALDKYYTVHLFIDEAFETSVDGTNIANENININSQKDEDKSWKVISEVVTTQFDILEVSDKSTGYIRTAWNTQNVGNKTIRTRIIVKGASSDSKAAYKIKLISEYAENESANIKNDELFKAWDRILKKYKDLIPELQDRLK